MSNGAAGCGSGWHNGYLWGRGDHSLKEVNRYEAGDCGTVNSIFSGIGLYWAVRCGITLEIMKKTLLTLLILSFILMGCDTPEYSEAKIEPAQYSIEEFLETTNYTGASFSPDQRSILVSSNETGIYNVYAIPVEGGDPVQLTRSTDNSVFSRGYFPNDARFLYTSDEGGNELNHIYVQGPDGSVTDLTPGESLKANFMGWAQDDQSFFISTNERDNRYFDLYEYDAETYERTMIFENNKAYELGGVSPDKRYISMTITNTNADNDAYVYDRETGAVRHLTEHEGDIQYYPEMFSKDSKSLYYTTDEDNEFMYLVRHDLETNGIEEILKVDWDVMYAYLTKNGKYMVVGINNDGRTELRLYEADTMTRVALPEMPDVNIAAVSISRNEEDMAFYANSSKMPGDLFYYDFSGNEPVQLTRSLNPGIIPNHLVDGEVVRFNSFDDVEIPGILYKPHQASAANKVPALVWVHGGPGGQSRIGYNPLIQYLVNHGYAVYAINNRGSSGYGKTFFHLDDQKHGTDDLDDCVESKNMLTATGYVDPDKIAIIGGSYGGYMTLAALTFRPDEFAAGVNLFGISNWVRTLESIPPWWESFRKYLENEMGPFDDMEFFRAKSPLFHADNIERPLMVLQGANDPRVIKAESDDIVAAVRQNNVPVEYLVFEDEGHGFVKKENQIEAYSAILGFLDQYVKGVPIVEPETENGRVRTAKSHTYLLPGFSVFQCVCCLISDPLSSLK